MNDKQPISLASLMSASKDVEFDFADYEGAKVTLCHLAREELQKLRTSCVTNKFDRKTHQPREDFDQDKFVEEYCKRTIKGWSGLKLKYVEELLLVELGDLNPEDTLPFTLDNAINLLKNSDFFDQWVTSTQSELSNFTGNK